MKTIKLTKGKVALVDDEDFENLNKFKWYLYEYRNIQYAVSSLFGKSIRMHRIIMNEDNPKVFIDHIDHDGLNNQKLNLRKCNASENQKNSTRRKNSSSIYLGVQIYKDKRCKNEPIRIRAEINNNDKNI